jgi:hypothetical protein
MQGLFSRFFQFCFALFYFLYLLFFVYSFSFSLKLKQLRRSSVIGSGLLIEIEGHSSAGDNDAVDGVKSNTTLASSNCDLSEIIHGEDFISDGADFSKLLSFAVQLCCKSKLFLLWSRLHKTMIHLFEEKEKLKSVQYFFEIKLFTQLFIDFFQIFLLNHSSGCCILLSRIDQNTNDTQLKIEIDSRTGKFILNSTGLSDIIGKNLFQIFCSF